MNTSVVIFCPTGGNDKFTEGDSCKYILIHDDGVLEIAINDKASRYYHNIPFIVYDEQ
jgi:hypothetical protein